MGLVSVLGKHAPAPSSKIDRPAPTPAPAYTQTSSTPTAAAPPQWQQPPAVADGPGLAPAPHSSVPVPAVPKEFSPLRTALGGLSALRAASKPCACSSRPDDGDQPPPAEGLCSSASSDSSGPPVPLSYGSRRQMGPASHAILDDGEPSSSPLHFTPSASYASAMPSPVGPATPVENLHQGAAAYPSAASLSASAHYQPFAGQPSSMSTSPCPVV